LFVGVFFFFESHEQFFSYLATVTITGDGAENLDLCLALTAFSSEGSFTGFFYVPHLLRHGTSVLKVISERPVILPSECFALGEGAITTYFKRLRLPLGYGNRFTKICDTGQIHRIEEKLLVRIFVKRAPKPQSQIQMSSLGEEDLTLFK
jgi:hypothetical protein